jgi:FkbM family methyltransferase
MDTRAFLYRRLSWAFKCVLHLPNKGTVRLYDKHQVASFQDVFCHPFYWRAINAIDSKPHLIVDCGAHCGHFSILASVAITNKFPDARPSFLLVEPNEMLIKSLELNIRSAGIEDQCTILRGLIGKTEGFSTLHVNPRNLLTSSINTESGSKKLNASYLNLAEHVTVRRVDVLKLDIEGSEFDFCQNNQEFLSNVKFLIAEVHHQAGSFDTFAAQVAKAGLVPFDREEIAYGNHLAMFRQAVP